MTDMELLTEKVNAIAAFMMADTPQERNEARIMFNETQRRNTSDRNESLDADGITRKVLIELGAPDHLKGHPYVVEAVVMSLEDRYYINNVTFGLYPHIAAKFDTTASRVERCIRHLIEVTWLRGYMDTLTRYFGNTIDPGRGKPTNTEFIARLANVVREQMTRN